VFWNQGMSTDSNLIYVLALGQRHQFDYLCNLADDFARARVRNLKKSIASGQSPKPLTTQLFCNPEKHGHFKSMSNVKVNVIDSDEKASGSPKPKAAVDYHVFSKTALSSFFGRIMPKLMFSPMTKINNHIEATVGYMEQATSFVKSLITSSQNSKLTVCPFQFDLVIAVGEAIKVAEEDDDGDDDPDEKDPDEDDDKYYNFVGDIEKKLKANKLNYIKTESKVVDRVFDSLLFQMTGKESYDPDYMHNKRIIGLVDRRHQVADKNQADDHIFMFEPPKKARNIPNNALPEWYIGASKMVLLPDMKFGDDSDDSKSPNNANDDQKEKVKKSEEFTTIGASFGAAGSVLTLSIHAKQENVIKMYLFCNGQCIRFMPSDIKVILPILFNMDENTQMGRDNIEYIKNKEVDGIIKVMEQRIVDEEFAAFQQSYM